MKLKLSGARTCELRLSRATHETETHGQYHIGELAFITNVSDKPYVTSAGICVRRDEMSGKVRNIRDREQATRELEQEAIKASVHAKQAAKEAEPVVVEVEATSV
jgi:hypothetical protein